MRALTLPGTNLNVSALCLGTAEFGANISRADAFRLLDAYTATGGNFIDTAKVYADWRPGERSIGEKTIRAWLRERRNAGRVIIATKGAHPDLARMNMPRLAPRDIATDIEASLDNLGVDVLDLWYLHRDDEARSVGETIETLNAQIAAGRIRHFGCSNWRTERIAQAQAYAQTHGLQGFSANQMMWSLATANPKALGDPTLVAMDTAMARLHIKTQLAATPYTSQAHGFFQKLESGAIATADAFRGGVYAGLPNQTRYARLRDLRARTGLSLTQLVLGYLMTQPFPTVPVIGPASIAQLMDSLTAADVTLAAADVAFLAADG
jgi:aryl-alcohol dehydrogenase-like predicted oxidoreductase